MDLEQGYYTTKQALEHSNQPGWKWWFVVGTSFLAVSLAGVLTQPFSELDIAKTEFGAKMVQLLILIVACTGILAIGTGLGARSSHDVALYRFRTSVEGVRLLAEGTRLREQFKTLCRLEKAQTLVNLAYGQLAGTITGFTVTMGKREPQSFVDELNAAVVCDWEAYVARARDLHARQEALLLPLWEASGKPPWMPAPKSA